MLPRCGPCSPVVRVGGESSLSPGMTFALPEAGVIMTGAELLVFRASASSRTSNRSVDSAWRSIAVGARPVASRKGPRGLRSSGR